MAQEASEQAGLEITCQEVSQWASAYLDEHVGDERKRQIVLHLAICAGCETYVKQIATVRDVMRALPPTTDVARGLPLLTRAFAQRACRSTSSE